MVRAFFILQKSLLKSVKPVVGITVVPIVTTMPVVLLIWPAAAVSESGIIISWTEGIAVPVAAAATTRVVVAVIILLPFLHRYDVPLKEGHIKVVNSIESIELISHFHKSESFRHACGIIHDNFR